MWRQRDGEQRGGWGGGGRKHWADRRAGQEGVGQSMVKETGGGGDSRGRGGAGGFGRGEQGVFVLLLEGQEDRLGEANGGRGVDRSAVYLDGAARCILMGLRGVNNDGQAPWGCRRWKQQMLLLWAASHADQDGLRTQSAAVDAAEQAEPIRSQRVSSSGSRRLGWCIAAQNGCAAVPLSNSRLLAAGCVVGTGYS